MEDSSTFLISNALRGIVDEETLLASSSSREKIDDTKFLESDLLLGKKTYLIIQAEESFPSELNLALELAQENFTAGLERVRTLLIDSGIRQKAEEKIKSTIKEADFILDGLNIETDKLSFFSKLITNREN